MRRGLWTLGVLLILLFGVGCGVSVPPDELRDVRMLPQDLAAYIVPGTAARMLVPADRQKQLADNYRRRYLAPWQATWRGRSVDDLFGIRTWLLSKSLFGNNCRPIPMRLRQQWLALCAEEEYPNADYSAITLRAANLRGLPTRQSAFYDPNLPGEGYPFDYLQYSSIPGSTPVHVRQRSLDGGWLLVETEAMFGWLPATDVAPVDEELIQQYTTTAWSVAIEDDVPLTDEHGEVLAVAGLGSLWAQGEPGKVWVAVRGANGHALLQQATVLAGAVRPFPLPLTPQCMAELGNRLLGNPYDWGGQFGGRDCSSTLRDLFACFGIYLPRNSAEQAQVGKRLDLKQFSAKERERLIMSQAEPWLSLACMPGHVMLYVGIFKGKPVFLHTLWGIKTKKRHAKVARHLVGKTVLTGLRPGDERNDLLRPDGLLVKRIESMVLLGGAGEQ